MIEASKLAEWRKSVEARHAFGWAVVWQLLEEVDSQQSTVDGLRAELAEQTADLRARSGLQIVELPTECPCWHGLNCRFLGPARTEEKIMKAGKGL